MMDEFDMKIIVDESLSINCKLKKEMTVNEFESIIMRAKSLAKASGYNRVMAIKTGVRRAYNTTRKNATWSDDAVTKLKHLHSEGVTVNNIAVKLGKTSRQCYDKIKNMKTMGIWD